MSTEIKNTLFRFVTMRAPELVEKGKVEQGFVQHPDLDQCFFDQYLKNPQYAIAPTKKENLANAANYWGTLPTTFKSREDVKSYLESLSTSSNNIYAFAIWLTSNRSSLKVADLEKRLNFDGEIQRASALTSGLNNIERINLWNNLIYQIISFKSGYVREAILSVLVADFFLENYISLGNDQKALRKLAQARIIIPKELVKPEEVTVTNPSNRMVMKNNSIITKESRKTLEIINLECQIKDLNSMLEKISLTEKKFAKESQKALDKYTKVYQNKVDQAYADATKIETNTIDPGTHKEVVEISYENLELPVYAFQAMDEIEFLLSKEDSASLFYNFVKKASSEHGLESLNELKAYINDGLKKLSQSLFKRTRFSNKVVSAGGVILPVDNGSAFRTTNTFTISVTPNQSNKKLVFLFNGIETGTTIESGQYTITFADNSTYVGTFVGDDTWLNSQLVIKTPIEVINEQNPIQDGDFSLSGVFISGLGRELFIEGTGTISISNPPNNGGGSGGPDEYLASPDSNRFITYRQILPGVDFKVEGFGDYRYEDKVIITTGPDDSSSSGDSVGNPTGTTTSTTSQTSIEYIPSGFGIKRLGIADYRKVEQEVCCYVPGEVSHIENVMAREYKEKSTRRLRRQEDTTTTSKEKETEKLSDTTSTERFEMNQEINSVLSEQNSFGIHASVHQDWKGGGMMAGADFAHNTSQEESNHQAVTNAQEVTERALERVVQKVKEERVTKIIEEFEENSKHGYDNRKGDKHVSGVYRWVDKIFKNRVVNYGKRLMYEFMIPEPASFHNIAAVSKDDLNLEVIEKPIDPRTIGYTNARSLNNNNYLDLATNYGAEVNPFPIPIKKSISKYDDQWNEDGRWARATGVKIEIPDGYKIDQLKGNVKLSRHNGGGPGSNPHGSVQIGAKIPVGFSNTDLYTFNYSFIEDEITKELEMKMTTWDIGIFSYDLIACLSVSNAALEKWQIETFNSIIDAYEVKLDEYNAKMEQLKAIQSVKAKTNPLFYRQIENNVLRKNCIEYIASHEVLGAESLITGNSVQDIRAKYDSAKLETYAAKVKFFEQAFEWDLMSYYFYPFYWSYKANWKDKYNVDEMDDAIFRAFLQSGMARVILTVRPGFEEAVNWYMATGQIWNGGQVPTMDDPLFISIVEELREPEGEVEETWESRVPTSLTVIQAGNIGLNVQGLPCDDDCKDFKLFDSDGNQVFNPDGNPVSTNPIQQNLDANNSDVLLGNVAEDLETVTESIEAIQADIEEIKATLDANTAANS
jgi:hypothetical protein